MRKIIKTVCFIMMGMVAGAEIGMASVRIQGPTATGGIECYTVAEAKRVLEPLRDSSVAMRVVIGTAENNKSIADLIRTGFIEPETHQQGYSIVCAKDPNSARGWLLAIAGMDNAGALYALRDLEHFEMDRFSDDAGGVVVKPFTRRDYPRIEHRGHWIWGCNMPDKKAWMENMSRWKMNELIHWDNYPPKKVKEYVDFAHSRGIRVIWGFGWGWNPDWNFTVPEEFDRGVGKGVEMCGSDAFNKEFFKREILRKIREDYVPSGCDGVYFQSFTERPKCQCPDCRQKSMGAIMLGKPSTDKHGTTVADHSVFCRRTPFMHVALAEAMWNPDSDTVSTAEALVSFLKANGGVPGFTDNPGLKAARNAQHDAVGKKVILATAYSPKYKGGGDQALTDGKQAGAANCKDPDWQGYYRQNLDAVVDLGKPMSVNALSAGFLDQQTVGVHLPKEVKFEVSYDCKTFEEIGTVKAPERILKEQRHSFSIEGLDLYKVRQVRVRASCAGEWLFVDEIWVNPLQQD